MNKLSLSPALFEILIKLTQEELYEDFKNKFEDTEKKYKLKWKSKKARKEKMTEMWNGLNEEIEKYNMLRCYSLKSKNGYMLVNK